MQENLSESFEEAMEGEGDGETKGESEEMYISTIENPAAPNGTLVLSSAAFETPSARSRCPLFTSTDPQRHRR